jgi:phosphoribosylformylglycinamidine cyclo-ligase
VFKGIAQDSVVMNTDDVLCVGVTDRYVLSNTIGRNAQRIGGNVLTALVTGYREFTETMRQEGITIGLGGGETADVGDVVTTVAVDSTLTTVARRSDIIDASKITPGNLVVGLASYGRATYETVDNSGIASNGFTFARHALLHHDYATRYPETYSSTLDPNSVYQGRYHLDDHLPGSDMTIGEAMLSPTRTYLPVARAILNEARAGVTGIIHCSGGGQIKNMRFGTGVHVIKDQLLPVPPIFRAIEDSGKVDRRGMYQVFNMGHRLEVYCEPDAAGAVIEAARRYNIEAQVVGRVEKSEDGINRVSITDQDGDYHYAAR